MTERDMTDRSQASPLLECAGGTPRDRRNQLRIAAASLAWGLCFTGANLLIRRDLLPAGPIPWIVAAVPSVAAVFLLVAYARFLREADELQRLIQLQALALGFGGGFFVMLGYQLFERLGAPPLGDDLMAAMPFLYVIGVLLGQTRYR